MILLVVINLLLLYFLFKPIFDRKYKNKVDLVVYENIFNLKEEIFSSALLMLQSNKTYMSFTDENSFYTNLSRIKNFLKRDNSHKIYAYYNFPKAFLLLGVIDYYTVNPRAKLLKEIEQQVEENYLDNNGSIKFKFDKIDQSLFGLVFIKLYNITLDEKYKKAAQHIYNESQSFKTSENIYLYRKKDKVLFIDTLGMIVPFLVEYAKLMKDDHVYDEAILQIQNYLNLTVSGNELPCHAYDLINDVRLGANNWSRGFAWFMIGLSSVSEKNSEMKVLFDSYYKKIKDLRIDNSYWAQFYAHTNDTTIDASATIMIYYAAMRAGGEVSDDLNKALKQSIDTKYFVENNSGDTIYINKYARSKGRSEVSQGLLLSLLINKTV